MTGPRARAWWSVVAAAVLVIACGSGSTPTDGASTASPAGTASDPVATASPPAASPVDASPGASTPAAGSADPAPSSPAADVCAIEQAPGPDDAPPGSGETDTSDQAGGRFALCLIGPPGIRVEGTAWCRWTPDRLAVEEVSGLPTTVSRNAQVDAFLDLRTSDLQIALTDAQGTVVTYAEASVPGFLREDGSDGVALFDAPLADGSASPPPGTAPRQTGTLRWQCAGPPAA